MQKPVDPKRLFQAGRWLAVTAAALAVLTSAGLVVRFTNGPHPAIRSFSPPALDNAEERSPVGRPSDTGISIRTPDVAVSVTRAAPAASDVGPKEDGSAVSLAPKTPPPTVLEPTSVNVVHLHRVGHCEGSLVVSREGLTFVPAEKTGKDKDAFALKYNQFLPTLVDSTLIIKSNTRTYRFRAAAAGKDDGGSQLDDVVGHITRFR